MPNWKLDNTCICICPGAKDGFSCICYCLAKKYASFGCYPKMVCILCLKVDITWKNKRKLSICSVMIQDSQCKIIQRWAENWVGRAVFTAFGLTSWRFKYYSRLLQGSKKAVVEEILVIHSEEAGRAQAGKKNKLVFENLISSLQFSAEFLSGQYLKKKIKN